MPSLRCMFFDKWLHKGQISQEEYDAVIKKLDGHDKQIRNDAIDECADKFADILSNVPNLCGRSCPVKCNWGTEKSCKDMCKKWLLEQLKGAENEHNNISSSAVDVKKNNSNMC